MHFNCVLVLAHHRTIEKENIAISRDSVNSQACRLSQVNHLWRQPVIPTVSSVCIRKQGSEYNQEIPQSHTAY